jgi:hypothetical protein
LRNILVVYTDLLERMTGRLITGGFFKRSKLHKTLLSIHKKFERFLLRKLIPILEQAGETADSSIITRTRSVFSEFRNLLIPSSTYWNFRDLAIETTRVFNRLVKYMDRTLPVLPEQSPFNERHFQIGNNIEVAGNEAFKDALNATIYQESRIQVDPDFDCMLFDMADFVYLIANSSPSRLSRLVASPERKAALTKTLEWAEKFTALAVSIHPLVEIEEADEFKDLQKDEPIRIFRDIALINSSLASL